MSSHLPSGLLILHSQRAEDLADTVFAWLARQPLAPLEEEVFLVQSNGMAEWLKMSLAGAAASGGVCAAARVELPARFLWRTYRQVLGRYAVPADSPLDKTPLTWRLMQQLPGLLSEPVFAPVAGFLAHGGADRQLQLCRRLADLLDQYQVYRSDWLNAWAQGDDCLPTARAGEAPPVPADQRWQPALWRALLAPLDAAGRAALRPALHQQVLDRLLSDQPPATPLPRRVVLFGMTHLPLPALQLLAALGGHCQVLMAIPNPCRFHWADTIDGRELLQWQRRRLPLKGGQDLAQVPLAQMHAHGHPLLSAWGRQGRDFIRQLDAFDDVQRAQARFELPRLDLFDESPVDTGPLLQRVQARIRDLVPLAEHAEAALDPDDHSIVFHSAHSPVRELEVLHDQLLSLLAAPPPPGGRALQPRDIVVMVPDIAPLAPAIRAVFGQYPRHDLRYIPFDLTDLASRDTHPLVAALDWLLRLPQQRSRFSELRDLLDLPALARRLGLATEDLPRLAQWMHGAGLRWGLHEPQRAALGLGACGPVNSGWWALRRMLLGYASGTAGGDQPAVPFADIEPYAEVAGLEAELAGSLAQLLERLTHWWAVLREPATPQDWATRGRALLADFFLAGDDEERQLIAALDQALSTWLEACTQAGFEQPVPLAVAREAWLDALDPPTLNRRFRAGGVTFCTLMPMRAIPFEVVCLLGMNDGDYPRRAPRSDFDLMALPGQARPGDRARRDDDRQLMLEALLSARRRLYISWTGRQVRDNSEQPPSVLVSQLRDYLAAAWGPSAVAQRSHEHPLQPFSRRYFEGEVGDPVIHTWAREWRQAHAQTTSPGADGESPAAPPAEPEQSEALPPAAVLPPAFVPDPRLPLSVARLTQFLRQPVAAYFRHRLSVVFEEAEAALPDDEAFGLAGLEAYQLVEQLLGEVLGQLSARHAGWREASMTAQTDSVDAQVEALVAEGVARLRRSGRFPLGEMGRRTEAEFGRELGWMLRAWLDWQAEHPQSAPRQLLQLAGEDGVRVEDWLDELYAPSAAEQALAQTAGEPARPVCLQVLASKLCGKPAKAGGPPSLRPEKLLPAWVRLVLAQAAGLPLQAVLIGRDATVCLRPPAPEQARATAQAWLGAWLAGQQAPLPVAVRTALAWLQHGGDLRKARLAYEGGPGAAGAERNEPSLARLFPDVESLLAQAGFAPWAEALYAPLLSAAERHARVELHAERQDSALFDDDPGTEEDEA